jgi:hypothetical protein
VKGGGGGSVRHVYSTAQRKSMLIYIELDSNLRSRRSSVPNPLFGPCGCCDRLYLQVALHKILKVSVLTFPACVILIGINLIRSFFVCDTELQEQGKRELGEINTDSFFKLALKNEGGGERSVLVASLGANRSQRLIYLFIN